MEYLFPVDTSTIQLLYLKFGGIAESEMGGWKLEDQDVCCKTVSSKDKTTNKQRKDIKYRGIRNRR